jgi:hypothetical protein
VFAPQSGLGASFRVGIEPPLRFRPVPMPSALSARPLLDGSRAAAMQERRCPPPHSFGSPKSDRRIFDASSPPAVSNTAAGNERRIWTVWEDSRAPRNFAHWRRRASSSGVRQIGPCETNCELRFTATAQADRLQKPKMMINFNGMPFVDEHLIGP